MSKVAEVIEHYEGALRSKEGELAASTAANAKLQAEVTDLRSRVLDDTDRVALARAVARFPDLDPPAPVEAPSEVEPAGPGTTDTP